MNDITPPKKTLSEVVAQADQAPVASASNVMSKRRRWPRVLFGIIGLALVVGGYMGWQTWNNRNYPPKGTYAIVASQSESQKNFDEIMAAYIKFDQQSAAGKDIDAKKVERRAADEVVLRLGLQEEASKRSKLNCTQQKVDEIMKDRYVAAGSRSDFYSQLNEQYGWTEQVTMHQECLEYYKEQLSDELISGHELFGIYVRWDIALGQPDDVKASVERKAVAKLTNDFLPMFEADKSDQDISAKADVNETTTDEEFNAKVVSIDEPPTRIIKLARFNSEVYKTFQQYSEGEDETGYVDGLAEGSHTKVFKSKTGYYVIYRSTKKFTGIYESYDQMLGKVVESAKVSKSYSQLPPAEKTEPKPQETSQGLSWVSKLLGGALRAITPRAEAATPNSITCYGDSHKLPFSIEYRDAATKSIIQSNTGQIKVTSTGDIRTPCKDEPAAGTNAFGVNIAYSGINNGQISYTTGLHPNPWSFGLTCYTSWRFNFGAPTGYEELSSADYTNKNRFYLKTEYASSNYAGYTASSIAGQYQIPQQYYANIANGAKGFTIRVYFTKKPPQEGPKGEIKSSSKYKKTNGEYTTGDAFPNDSLTEDQKKKFFCLKGLKEFTPSVDYSTRCSANIVGGLAQPNKLWGGSQAADKLDVGVYSAGIYGGLTDYSIAKIEVTYPAQCQSHAAGKETFSSVGAVKVRVCEGQTPTVVFYFDPPSAAARFGPWLKAQRGNVMSLGSIVGQSKTINGGAGSGNQEAEYLVMAVSSTNFCSPYNLGKVTDTASCRYDLGYESNTDFDANTDKVIAGVEKIFEGGGYTGSCSSARPYKVFMDMKSTFQATQSSTNSGFGGTPDCPVIGKVDATSFAAQHFFTQDRATIYVDQDLTITANNIVQFSGGGYASVNKIPNVGLIVKGNVTIAPGVTQLDMSIYASGKIKTCSTYPSSECRNQLKVRGMLAAGKGFEFGRNAYGSSTPAELIIGSGLVEAFPPPGFLDLYGQNVKGVKYLTTKGSPRF